MAEADGAQLEFRVAGHLGRDKQIKHDVINHVDIHAFTARSLTEAGEPTSRQDAKVSTFRPLYGGTSGSEAVQAYCKAFTEKYKQLNETQRAWAMYAAEHGYLDTEWGMRYYFPHVSVTSYGYIKGQQAVFNYPVQALATAEIIPIALVHFWFRTRNAELFIVNTVHDSIICELPEKEIELFGTSVVKALTTDVYNYLKKVYGMKFTIPLGVGMKLGSNWGIPNEEYAEILQNALIDEGLGDNLENDGGEITLDVYP
jgi:DNA polymerase I-like protein with 3'-5' exonuclease and polymerase domains